MTIPETPRLTELSVVRGAFGFNMAQAEFESAVGP